MSDERLGIALSGLWSFFKRGIVYLLLFLLTLPACSGGADQVILVSQVYPVETDVPIAIDINNGHINISNGIGGQVTLGGSVKSQNSQQPSAVLESDRFFISSDDSSTMFNLDLQVPSGAWINIDTYGATITVRDFVGDLDITSAAGDIEIDNMNGKAVVRANRGDVTIEYSTGEFHLPGNYGLLNLKDVSGDINASTIMGTIRYEGHLTASDRINFETDHGPVETWLDPASDVTVMVKTTTGVTYCVVPGLNPDGAGCKGQLGNGDGLLQIRTVSGEVNLKLIP